MNRRDFFKSAAKASALVGAAVALPGVARGDEVGVSIPAEVTPNDDGIYKVVSAGQPIPIIHQDFSISWRQSGFNYHA